MEKVCEYIKSVNTSDVQKLIGKQLDLQGFKNSERDLELFVCKTREFSHTGDFLVGFYCESDTSFDMYADGKYLYTQNLKRCEFSRVFDTTFLPIHTMFFTHIHLVGVKHDIYFVWAFVKQRMYQEIFYYHLGNKYYYFKYGMLKTSKDALSEFTFELPDFTDYLKLAKEKTECIKEELMMVTWHPDRLRKLGHFEINE